MMGHDRQVIMAIKPTSRSDQTAAIFGRKFPLKPMFLSCFELNFWSIREEIK